MDNLTQTETAELERLQKLCISQRGPSKGKVKKAADPAKVARMNELLRAKTPAPAKNTAPNGPINAKGPAFLSEKDKVKEDPPGNQGQKRKIKFAFPTRSKCPSCQMTNTIAYSTQGKIQYRKCRRGHCHAKYTVIGTEI